MVVDLADEPWKKPTCTVLRDYKTGDHHWVVEREDTNSKEGASPRIDVWWNRDAKKIVGGRTIREERLVLRQENGKVGADVLMITHGQLYDLIDALNRAVEFR